MRIAYIAIETLWSPACLTASPPVRAKPNYFITRRRNRTHAADVWIKRVRFYFIGFSGGLKLRNYFCPPGRLNAVEFWQIRSARLICCRRVDKWTWTARERGVELQPQSKEGETRRAAGGETFGIKWPQVCSKINLSDPPSPNILALTSSSSSIRPTLSIRQMRNAIQPTTGMKVVKQELQPTNIKPARKVSARLQGVPWTLDS